MGKTTRPQAWFGLGGAVLLAGLLAAACSPATPVSPSFATDLHPILAAHCLRCHGALLTDAGTFGLNADADPLLTTATNLTGFYHVYLVQFASSGDCADAGVKPPPTCRLGAQYFATNPSPGSGSQLYQAIHGGGNYLAMPPAPAASLDNWEIGVLDAWIANPRP